MLYFWEMLPIILYSILMENVGGKEVGHIVSVLME